MKAFLGYPMTKSELKDRANRLNPSEFRYAGCPNATTEYVWELYERFSRIGPFRLMTAMVNDELGYVFVVGWDDCKVERIPHLLLHWTGKVFRGEPRLFTMDEHTRLFKSRKSDGEGYDVIQSGGVITSNLKDFR